MARGIAMHKTTQVTSMPDMAPMTTPDMIITVMMGMNIMITMPTMRRW